jgi:hypothetical protein
MPELANSGFPIQGYNVLKHIITALPSEGEGAL